MVNDKQRVSYSIISYTPDLIKGEIINVGVISHNHSLKKVKIFLLEEKSPKLKSISETATELNEYKSYKETLEYYLKNSKNDMSGVVGNINIASYYDKDFLNKIILRFSNKKLNFSTPDYAFTKDENKFFETILYRYIGKSNISIEKVNNLSAKKIMKTIFTSSDNLNKRVKSDVIINPIKELEDLKVKIDFTFKNGKWNYMQVIPKINNSINNTEWFSKVKLLLENDTETNKIHLIYKKSDLQYDLAAFHLLKYLQINYSSLEIHDIDVESEISDLCTYIENEGQILEEAI